MYILMTTGLFVQHVMPAVLICMIASVATMTDACLYLVLLFEIETKLIVPGKAPQLIMEEIATHGVFGKHCRMPAGVRWSFRTSPTTPPARSLSGRGIALRPRKKAGSALFCIKQDRARMQQAWSPGRYRSFTGQGRVTMQHRMILNPMGAWWWIMISYPPT